MSGSNTRQLSPTSQFEAPLDPQVADKMKKLWNT